jgi:hypothetical protein
MNPDNDDIETVPMATRSLPHRIGRVAANGVAYTLFGIGLLCLYVFFAPFVGLPTIGVVTEVLPTIAAPTEAEGVFVNASPLIAGVVATSAAVWLR